MGAVVGSVATNLHHSSNLDSVNNEQGPNQASNFFIEQEIHIDTGTTTDNEVDINDQSEIQVDAFCNDNGVWAFHESTLPPIGNDGEVISVLGVDFVMFSLYVIRFGFRFRRSTQVLATRALTTHPESRSAIGAGERPFDVQFDLLRAAHEDELNRMRSHLARVKAACEETIAAQEQRHNELFATLEQGTMRLRCELEEARASQVDDTVNLLRADVARAQTERDEARARVMELEDYCRQRFAHFEREVKSESDEDGNEFEIRQH